MSVYDDERVAGLTTAEIIAELRDAEIDSRAYPIIHGSLTEGAADRLEQLTTERDALADRCEALESITKRVPLVMNDLGEHCLNGCMICPKSPDGTQECPDYDEQGDCPTLEEAIAGWIDRIRAERQEEAKNGER